MNRDVGFGIAASVDLAEKSRTIGTMLITAESTLRQQVGGLSTMLAVLSEKVRRNSFAMNKLVAQNERLALEWNNQQDITIALARRVRELEEQMGFKDVETTMPDDIRLATENELLKKELESLRSRYDMAVNDLAEARATAKVVTKSETVLVRDPDLEREAQDLRVEVNKLLEKYDTAQEMLKLYRRLVKLPQEDVGGGLTIDEYIDLAAKTDSYEIVGDIFPGSKGQPGGIGPLLVAALGLCGEAGEFADILKKGIAQGHPIFSDELTKELGDILWYFGKACRELGVSGDVVAQKNIEKLKARYGEKFSKEKSINRVEYAQALEAQTRPPAADAPHYENDEVK